MKIKLCQLCFDDSDLDIKEVEIVSEFECVELDEYDSKGHKIMR